MMTTVEPERDTQGVMSGGLAMPRPGVGETPSTVSPELALEICKAMLWGKTYFGMRGSGGIPHSHLVNHVAEAAKTNPGTVEQVWDEFVDNRFPPHEYPRSRGNLPALLAEFAETGTLVSREERPKLLQPIQK